MSYYRSEEWADEFRHENPPCRAHGVHGCDDCEDQGDEDDDDEPTEPPEQPVCRYCGGTFTEHVFMEVYRCGACGELSPVTRGVV